MKNSTFSSVSLFFTEMLQLLYWAYFKPYMLTAHLKTLHPDLSATSNPFDFQTEFSASPKLKKFANQAYYLSLLSPLIAILVTFPLCLLASIEFDFIRATLFCVGWIVGLTASMKWNKFSEANMSEIGVFLGIVFALTTLWNKGFTPRLLYKIGGEPLTGSIFSLVSWIELFRPTAVGIAVGVAVGVAGGVAFGVAVGVALGVVVGVAFGVAVGVAVGVAGGVAVGVAFGVAVGVAFGVAFGVAGGVAVGVAFGVAGGVAGVLGAFRVYFWLPELLWSVGLGLFSNPRQSAGVLQQLPPRFDQLIYLPLPFVATLIAEAYPVYPAAAQETLTYLTTSTNQQKVATRAMTLIAINELASCQTLRQIAAVADELSWLPSPAPKTLLPLQSFVELSQGIREAVGASSLYRQIELIKTNHQKLQATEQQLAVAGNAKTATQFGAIVNQWSTILQTAQRTLADQAKSSTELPQVYIAGPPVEMAGAESTDNRFQGRQDLFREIETLSSSTPPPILLLYGGRRTGKTSALKQLPRKVGPDIIPLYVDVQGAAITTTLPGLAQSLAQSVATAARTARNLQLRPPENYEFEREPFLRLQKWLAEVEKVVPNKRFLLCLDEFERFDEIVSETGSRAPLNFLRSLIQNNPRWILLFSGSHYANELNPYWNDYLINSRSLRISYLNPSEAKQLILHPVANFPSIYTQPTVDAIISLTRCQPYFVQLTCYELVELLNQNERTTATPQDVETIIPKVLETGGSTFRERLQALAESDRRFLLTNAELSQISITAENQRPIVRRLIKTEILEPIEEQEDLYQFQIPLFQRFVVQCAHEGW